MKGRKGAPGGNAPNNILPMKTGMAILNSFAKGLIGKELVGKRLSVVFPKSVNVDYYNEWHEFGKRLTRLAEEFGIEVSGTLDTSADGIAVLGNGGRLSIPRNKDVMRVAYKPGDYLRPPFISAALNVLSWHGHDSNKPYCISGHHSVLVDILRDFGGSRVDATCDHGISVRPNSAPLHYIPCYPNPHTRDIAAQIAILNLYDLLIY